MSTMGMRVLKGLVGLVLLAIVLYVASGYLREYRSASAKGAGLSSESTVTAGSPSDDGEGSGDVSSVPTGDHLIVTIEGLNLREKPDRTATSLQGLEEGARLAVLGKQGDWYQVQAADGAHGWVTDNPSYTKLEKR